MLRSRPANPRRLYALRSTEAQEIPTPSLNTAACPGPFRPRPRGAARAPRGRAEGNKNLLS
eukprot:269170-Pyramimonas_sp.AAC.1